jgi:hypothetical protein
LFLGLSRLCYFIRVKFKPIVNVKNSPIGEGAHTSNGHAGHHYANEQNPEELAKMPHA